MKLEVAMYVRTNSGIRKCITVDYDNTYEFDEEIYNEYGDALLWLDEDEGELEKYISKASHNIIDLIEVGDYVNGFRVDEIGEYHSIRTDKVETYAKVNCSALLNCFYEEDIKSIVTKEQFESMSYKVGE